MNSKKVRELIERLESLHREFESKFPTIYEEKSAESLYKTIRGLYSVVGKKMDIIGDLYGEMAPLGGEIEGVIKDLQRTEHQMKFRLEELMTLLSKPLDYSEKNKLKLLLDRLVHFHRMYDYTLSKALRVLTREAEGLKFMEKIGIESENQKKAPASIIERLERIEKIEERLEKLLRFTGRLYSHPGDVHKVEEALKSWHRMGLLWVESRNVEKASGVRNPDEILEGLTLIGVVERKERGGESVYRHRDFS